LLLTRYSYVLALLNKSKSIIECGTSFGLSTIYLALAVNRNVNGRGPDAFGVLTIEKDGDKMDEARQIWTRAGTEVENWIDARHGNLLEVLENGENLPKTVDLLFLDGESVISV
jgi:predicted O-methyltransferase YrrM